MGKTASFPRVPRLVAVLHINNNEWLPDPKQYFYTSKSN
jgi:hypothetical protein